MCTAPSPSSVPGCGRTRTATAARTQAPVTRNITHNDDKAAKAVPYIRDIVQASAHPVPIVGCFHYNGHSLLTKFPACAQALDKYRINPGNVGFGEKRDDNFEIMINQALIHNKAVRIGVNWGSLDEALSQKLMDKNAELSTPFSSDFVMREALVQSALISAEKAIVMGLPKDKIILSAKVSKVQDLIAVYTELSKRCNYVLHLGLTEAGSGTKGIVTVSSALSILLQNGIGDTIRASITPRPQDGREEEVLLCREILQSLGLRFFTPQVTSCPGCGRTNNKYFQHLADDIQEFLKSSMKNWRKEYAGIEKLSVAVMGCIVNGPGESKHADIGISLPGNGENPAAPVFIDGNKFCTLRGDNITCEFKEILRNYIAKRFKKIS